MNMKNIKEMSFPRRRESHNVATVILLLASVLSLNACGDWLDVVPDGLPNIDMAFSSREQALKYLGCCYSYMPRHGNPNLDPAILGGDEFCVLYSEHLMGSNRMGLSPDGYQISIGMQNAVNPLFRWWESMYQALRYCNTFLEKADNIPDLLAEEREKWKAEVKVLKAYYHFCLVQMYGPVPLLRENLPVYADVTTVKVEREPVDECFRYIVELIDEACTGEELPLEVTNPTDEWGRITKIIALALKAKVLVTAASPLYNGNTQQATLRNRDGKPLFNTTEDAGKWQKAMDACREAIEACNEVKIQLYQFDNAGNRYTDTIATQLSLRNAFTLRDSRDVIWANTQSLVNSSGLNSILFLSMPTLKPEANFASPNMGRFYNMPLKIAAMFYTRNGVPIEEDNTMPDKKDNLYNLRTAKAEDALYIRQGRTTVDLNFDREPRFYAWVGFDGGVWFGGDRIDDKNPNSLRYLGLKVGEPDGDGSGFGNPTGYLPKKYIPVSAQVTAVHTISATSYAWSIMRLSELYLLYAEAINEAEGPNGANSVELFKYIDLVRKRAGLNGVKESWNKYANNTKYSTPAGMREIIRRERLIELCMEGHRFWDIRRWKTAPDEYREPQKGWNNRISTADGTESEVNQIMYTPQVVNVQKFNSRDYFWPVRNSDMDVNPNLVQNIGW